MAAGMHPAGDKGRKKKRLSALRDELVDGGQHTVWSMIDNICQAFGCTPNEALEQDPRLVLAIMECRALKEARRIHNRDVTKLQEQPELVTLWMEMTEEDTDG